MRERRPERFGSIWRTFARQARTLEEFEFRRKLPALPDLTGSEAIHLADVVEPKEAMARWHAR